jgi:hypothetical protein
MAWFPAREASAAVRKASIVNCEALAAVCKAPAAGCAACSLVREFAPECALAASIAKERQDALVALRAWIEEWSEVARAVITRRDHLILLGLASRRKSGAEDEEEEAPLTAVEPVV